MNRKISILGLGVLCSMVSLQTNAGNEKEAELRIVQKNILEDPLMDQVHRMAYKTVSTGLNAGDGYGEVWIRDFNTFIQVAMDVMPDKNVQDCLNTFFHFQGAEGDIVDGYIDIRKADLNNVGGYKYRLSKTCPQFAAHKNTVETDHETSLIQAVYQYIRKSGNTDYLKSVVAGKTVEERMEWALRYLMEHKYNQEYGLITGATTADWGDVQPEHIWGVEIDENTHYTIDIYDNAMLVLAIDNFLEMTTNEGYKSKWGKVKNELAQNIRKHLWDKEKRKFIPHIYLNGSPFPQNFDENQIYYHGGTAVAILAGLLSKEEIEQANNRMLENVRKAGAQTIGLTMYPTYPAGFFKGVGMYPYGYQNGGDWTWFGARMIWGLAENGFIKEAYEELRPMLARVVRNKGFNEWYTQSGEPKGSGTFRGEAGVLVRAIEQLRSWAENYQEVPLEEARKGMVIFTFGQSNSANHGWGNYTPKHKVYNYFEGKLYPSADPLIGATGNGGSVWNRLADKLIEDGCTGQVTIIPIGVGGVEISAWAKGGYLHNRLIETVEQLKEQHITPDCILWHQGESDNINNTSEENYIRMFETIREVFRSRGINSPIGVAVASYHPYCVNENEGNDPAIRNAQKKLAKKYDDIFEGPDTDKLNKAFQRGDGVHFSEKGQETHAAGWLKAIKKNCF